MVHIDYSHRCGKVEFPKPIVDKQMFAVTTADEIVIPHLSSRIICGTTNSPWVPASFMPSVKLLHHQLMALRAVVWANNDHTTVLSLFNRSHVTYHLPRYTVLDNLRMREPEVGQVQVQVFVLSGKYLYLYFSKNTCTCTKEKHWYMYWTYIEFFHSFQYNYEAAL
jgi:hypothetical protein